MGAKINDFLNLLQAKTKKITAKYKNLTFAAMKDPFLWGVYSYPEFRL
jgi:hypothetical protein